MQVNLRREPRWQSSGTYTLCWTDEAGLSRSAQALGSNMAASGMCVSCCEPVNPGVTVFIQGNGVSPSGYGTVRHCGASGDGHNLGIEFHEETRRSVVSPQSDTGDYYEFLQISPKAGQETIRRIYRFMAARYHPDNPETGDQERFLFLNRVYQTLSDTQRRAEYDASRQAQSGTANPLVNVGALLDGVKGKANRRLAILGLLYNKRRLNSQEPGISLWELEAKMCIPREHLEFATWYLKAKHYLETGDNSELVLTASGVDYVEGAAEHDPMLHRLLSAGARSSNSGAS